MSKNFEAIKTAAKKHMAELKVSGIASKDLFHSNLRRRSKSCIRWIKTLSILESSALQQLHATITAK